MPLPVCKCRNCDRCIFEAENEEGLCLACKKGFHSNSNTSISQN